MSRPQEPQPAKLIVGLLFRDFGIQRQALTDLRDHFGPMDLLTEPKVFTYTTYYDREMGSGLYRQTCSFVQLIQTERMPEVKLSTNRMEIELSIKGKRQVNIDPGVLSKERLVLATGKNYTHRIYLRNGIYADLTLIYQNGAYRPLPWTYPDYRDVSLRRLLGIVRQKLIFQYTNRLPRKVPQKGASL